PHLSAPRSVQPDAAHEPNTLDRQAQHLWETGQHQRARTVMHQAMTRANHPHIQRIQLEWLIDRLDKPVDEGVLRLKAGDLWMRVGHFDKARAHYTSAHGLLGSQAAVLRRLGQVLCEQGHYDQARKLAERALTAPDSQEEQGEILFTLGWTAAMRGDYTTALAHAQHGLRLDTPSPISRARLFRLLGTVHWHQGSALEACDAFTHGKRLAEQHGAEEIEAECWMGLGTSLFMQGQHEASLDAYTQAVALHERHGRIPQLAKSLNGQGIALYLLGRWDETATVWEAFRQTCSRTGNRPDLVMAYNNLGFLHKDRGDLERAALELRRGLQEAQEAGFGRGEAMVHGNLGEVLTRMGDWVSAQSHLDQAHHLAHKLGAAGELLETERRMAELQLAKGSPDKALHRATVCLERPDLHDNPGEAGHLERVCGESLVALGHLGDARVHLGRARELQNRYGSLTDRLRAELAWHQLQLRDEPWSLRPNLQRLRDEAKRLGARPLALEASRLLALWPRDSTPKNTPCPKALKALVEVAQEISQITDLNTLLEIVTERALTLTDGGRALLIVIEDGREVKVHTARWRAETQRDELAIRMSRTIADQVYSTGQSVVITDTTLTPELQAQESILSLKLKAIVCVPLKIRDKTLGILYVDSQQTTEGLGPQHLPVLEALGAQAAMALHHTRLIHAEKRRQALAAYLAHDFRTPLASLNILIELIREELSGIDPELLDILQSTETQLNQLDRMTRQIVDLERLQDPIAFHPKAFSLHEVAHRVLVSLVPLANHRKVALRWTLSEQLPPLYADPDALRRLFTNVIGNAIKALEPGATVTVEASLLEGGDLDTSAASQLGWSPAPELNPDRRIALIFRDDGPGLTEAQARKLSMDREQWLKEQGSSQQRAGLGLFIVRELVLRQGGTLRCDTSPGQGTTFTITLPTARD
ncbi:MAG: tetratricopeptide repeat protein, partial [Myxococcota bacterium]